LQACSGETIGIHAQILEIPKRLTERINFFFVSEIQMIHLCLHNLKLYLHAASKVKKPYRKGCCCINWNCLARLRADTHPFDF
jgi:hypothetical protein